MMCCVKEYISEYKLAEVYDVSLLSVYKVRWTSVFVFLEWSVASARLCVQRLGQGQKQVKDLFRYILFIY